MQRILIVEDDQVTVDLYRQWLEEVAPGSGGAIFQFAADGKEAEHLLNKTIYSATLLDLALPFISGAELFRRHHLSMGRVFIVSMYAAIARLDGKYGTVSKPVSRERFKDLISECLGGSHAYTGASYKSVKHQTV